MCLRCERPLDRLERAEDIQFWRCTHCQRDYAEHGAALTDRWLSPLSLVLYGILFSKRPQDDAARVVGQLAHLTDDERARIVTEIREELAHPKQRVRDILPLAYGETVVTEDDVRAFLAAAADQLERR
jgi:hypothetical protein